MAALMVPLVGLFPGEAAAATAPDTTITSAPASATSSTSASFAFTATLTPATFTCKLDTGSAASCTTPKSYSGLAAGTHTFSVYATSGGATDTTPATATWKIDTVVPTTPTGLVVSSASPTSTILEWNASTDNTAVTGYDAYRDGVLLVSPGNVLTYNDLTVVGGSMHTYAVRARDAVGNVSALTATVSVTAALAFNAHLTSART